MRTLPKDLSSRSRLNWAGAIGLAHSFYGRKARCSETRTYMCLKCSSIAIYPLATWPGPLLACFLSLAAPSILKSLDFLKSFVDVPCLKLPGLLESSRQFLLSCSSLSVAFRYSGEYPRPLEAISTPSFRRHFDIVAPRCAWFNVLLLVCTLCRSNFKEPSHYQQIHPWHLDNCRFQWHVFMPFHV